MECPFCQPLLNQDKRSIYETKHWKVLLSSDQSYLGRCLVMLKRHCGVLAELEQEEWLDFSELVKKLEFALKKAFSATMFNWTCLMNNTYKTKNPNPHVHWHFRPRYRDKVEFAGIAFEDPEFGHHYTTRRKLEISTEIKKEIIEKIKNNIRGFKRRK